MKVTIERDCIRIETEGVLEEVFIEEVLRLYETGDSIKLIRGADGNLCTVRREL